MKYEDYDFYSNDFYNQLKQRIDIVRSKFYEIPVKFTGNAFVDAGIYGTAVKREKNPNSISIGDILDTILEIDGKQSFGKDFAVRNYRVKCITTIFTANTVLYQSSYGSTTKSGIKKCPTKYEPSELQIRLYVSYIIEFLIAYGENHDLNAGEKQCMVCGSYTNFDFNHLETVFNALGKEDPISKKKDFGSGPTRAWFPLLGTTSSIQSLPGFREPNIVCGKCLALVQFLPQLVDLQNGKLTLYQSNNQDLVLGFYRNNLHDFEERHHNTPIGEQLDTIGSDSWDYYINNLLKIISENVEDLGNSNLILWRFSNSGQDPSLEYIKLPNEVLQFLHVATVQVPGDPIKRLIREEENVNLYFPLRLFRVIEARRDYPLFYQHTAKSIEYVVSQNFFDLYQIYIRGWYPSQLETLIKIAKGIRESNEDESELLRILKQRSTSEIRNYSLPIIIQMTNDEKIHVQQIIELFEIDNSETNDLDPWKILRFYLHPKLSLDDLYWDIDKYITIDYDHPRMHAMAIIQKVASDTLERAKHRSSFDREKYISNLTYLRFRDFRQHYIDSGYDNITLTWQQMEYIEHHLFRYEILFYFRIFSIQSFEKLNITLEVPNLHDLKNQNGLNPILSEVLIEYAESRIQKIGKNRFFKEIDYDLFRGNYSARRFFNLLLSNIDTFESEIDLNEYHFFTYELEYQGTFKPRYSSQQSPKFSWSRLKDKIRLFISQYQEIRVPNLEQQLLEEKQ